VSITNTIRDSSLAKLALAGQTTANIKNLHVQELTCVLVLNVVSVTIFGDNLQIGSSDSGNIFKADLIAVGEGISLLGSVVVWGSIKAISSYLNIQTTHMQVLDSWSVPLEILNSQLTLSGNLIGSIHVGPGSSLFVDGQRSVYGFVINEGNVYVSSENFLLIEGDYYQFGLGRLSVDVINSHSLALEANGALNLGGAIEYKLAAKPFMRSAKYLIAVGDSVHGSFQSEESALHGASVEINSASGKVYVIYNFSAADIPAWFWLLFVALVGEVGLIFAVIAIRYRRHVFLHPVLNFFYAARIINIWRILDLEPSARS